MKRNIKYLFTGAGMLAVCSVLAKLLGAMYRIPLTNILGGEGMGLYQMVFPLYTLLLTVSSGGLPVAISRLIAVKLADGDEKGAAKVLNVAVVALFIVGLLGTLTLLLLNDFIAGVQGNREAALAYVGIAPAVTFVAVLSCYRGYYQGRENMLPSAVSQLVEQAVKLGLGLYFASLFLKKGTAYGVLGALLGVSVSEFLAMAVLIAMYFFTRLKVKRNSVHVRRRRLMHEMPGDMTYFGSETTVIEVKNKRKRRKSVSGRGENARKSRTLEADEELIDINDETAFSSRAARKKENHLRNIEAKAELKEKTEPAEAVTKGLDSDFAGDMTAELGLTAASEGLQSSCKSTGQKNVHGLREILKSIAVVALPVTFGSLVLPVTQVADSVLIINILTSLGYSASAATMAYGLVNGTVMTLVNVPVVVIFAFSAALLPKIAKACYDCETVTKEAGFSLKLCSALGLLMFLFMFVYADPLVKLLYTRGLSDAQLKLSAKLLKFSGFSIFYVSIVQVCTAVLQGLNKAKKPAVNLFIGALIKVALTAGLLYVVGIFGAVMGSIACYAVTAVLDLVSVRREIPLFLRANKAYVPVLAAAAFLLFGVVTRHFLSFLPPLLLLLVSVPVALVAFLAVIFGFRWFEIWEIKRLIPFFSK